MSMMANIFYLYFSLHQLLYFVTSGKGGNPTQTDFGWDLLGPSKVHGVLLFMRYRKDALHENRKQNSFLYFI